MPPLKLNPAKGVCGGGSENENLGHIFYFTRYFTDFSAVMYLYEVKESTLKSFVKIEPSMLKKMAVLRQIKTRGAFVATPIFLYIFMFFECQV